MVRAVRHLLVLVALLVTALPALAERKLAFVAGIDAYSRLPADQQLRRAVADAEAVAATLTGLGFQVTRLGRDATLFGFHTGFGAFTQSIEPGDTVLFFFAGHGVAIDTTNYLLPSDIPPLGPGGETVVKGLSIAEPAVISDIQGRGARVTVLVIDACRNNPFPKAGTRSLGLSRGFARAEPPEGVFSLYSAGAGQEALDRLSDSDGDANSVFTRVFLSEIRKPGINLNDLGESVRERVAELARSVRHQQVPAVYNQVLGARRIQFAGAAPAPVLPIPEPPKPAPIPADPDANTWLFLKESQDAQILRRFAERLSVGPLRREVEDHIAALPGARKEAALPPAPTVDRADGYPSRVIKVVVPFAAGGDTDLQARALADKLSEKLSQPLIVENLAGGGGSLGTAKVAVAQPDGYTLLMANSSLVTSALTAKKAPFDLRRDFEPTAIMSRIPLFVVVHPSVRANSMAELAAYIKAEGGLDYGSPGIGTVQHLAAELLASRLNVKLRHVPYRGAGPAINDLVAGRIKLYIDTANSVEQQVRGGALKVLAVTTAGRSPVFPEVRTVQESGVSDYDVFLWYGVLVPVRTPDGVSAKLGREIEAAMASSEIRARLRGQGFEPATLDRVAFARVIADDFARWGAVVKSIGLVAQ